MTRALQIASARGVPGTAGPMVRNRERARLLLANYHVLLGPGASVGDEVWAISPDDSGIAPEATPIGRVLCGHLGTVSFANEVYFVDCALIELSDSFEIAQWLRAALVAITRSSQITTGVPGMRLSKNGAATGRTEGVLVDVAYPDRPFIADRGWEAPRQLLVDSRDPELNFSAPGDSGAALFDDRGRVVGLLWGSNGTGQGIACPIGPVLDCLGVALPSTLDLDDCDALGCP